ncbi:hypothetical protein HNR33_004464 [Brassicibacter mesophilus]
MNNIHLLRYNKYAILNKSPNKRRQKTAKIIRNKKY